jgi:predicted ATPase
MKTTIDYRQLAQYHSNSFFTPINERTRIQLWNSFVNNVRKMDIQAKIDSAQIPVMMNRSLQLEGTSAYSKIKRGICYSTFNYLCGSEKGAADYKAITEYFHTVRGIYQNQS